MFVGTCSAQSVSKRFLVTVLPSGMTRRVLRKSTCTLYHIVYCVTDPTYCCSVIEKVRFQEMKNNHIEEEPMCACIHCGRMFHKICVLWHESIWSEGYQCSSCLKENGTQRKENKWVAKS